MARTISADFLGYVDVSLRNRLYEKKMGRHKSLSEDDVEAGRRRLCEKKVSREEEVTAGGVISV